MSTHSTIDLDTASVTRTVTIAAPRDLVWATLTAPDQLALWFGQRADFPHGVHRGATGSFGWQGEGDFPARIEVWEPTDRFAFVWGTPGEELRPDNSTTATFDLVDAEPSALNGGGGDGAGTVLTVVETGFDNLSPDATAWRAAMEDNAQGWNEELDQLVAHLDRIQRTAPAQADPDAGTITRTVLVDAEMQRVWETLTDPTAIGEWWGHPAVFDDGLRAGALGTFEWVGHGLFPIRVIHLDAPETSEIPRFEFRWGDVGEAEPGPTASLVTFTLSRVGEQTLVTVVEGGFGALEPAARRAAMEENVGGWNAVLDSFLRSGARA